MFVFGVSHSVVMAALLYRDCGAFHYSFCVTDDGRPLSVIRNSRSYQYPIGKLVIMYI